MDKWNQAERYIHITELIHEHKSVQIEKLAFDMGVSENTIRRDLTALAEQGILTRTKGGAMVNHLDNESRPFSVRGRRNYPGKQHIAQRAVEMIEDGDTIIIDSGTTTLEIARRLVTRSHITVVTNSLAVADILSPAGDITTILCGGIIHSASRSLIGMTAEEFFRSTVKADKCFLSAKAVSDEGIIYEQNMFEPPVKLAMIGASTTCILLADMTKMGTSSLVPLGDFSPIHCLISDGTPSPAMYKHLSAHSVEIIRV